MVLLILAFLFSNRVSGNEEEEEEKEEEEGEFGDGNKVLWNNLLIAV
jgi:hypothetical protein